ncbi:ATP-binding protein [Pseudonocardia nigra]|uniref:ATP-binding protein n=1 Tax=Pseudonocardia nigra TaxID=1921578 RepID=UPI001C5D3E4C|nr:ATP-binding protein [Pseudonocardia nigra]
MRAAAESPGQAREHTRSWLEHFGFPAEAVDDVELAVNEAVSNAVEHAYPPEVADGVVEIAGEVEVLPDRWRQIRFWVRDRGRWRPQPSDPGFRGRGLLMMAALMAEAIIRHGDPARGHGTEIVLLTPPVPPASS